LSRLCSQVLGELTKLTARELARIRKRSSHPLDLLDVGCWNGETTSRYQEILGGSARGVEVFEEQVPQAKAKGIDVANIDLEVSQFPWPDESVDVVVSNQVFEHLKNVWLPMSEVARVLKPGGYFLFSVPNLASFHNRIMLGFGYQPSSIRTFGPHIRGLTYRQTREYLEYGGFLETERVVGIGFYPLPVTLATPFARTWVGGSHTPLFVMRRIAPSRTVPPWRSLSEDAAQLGVFTHYAKSASHSST
jgi:SAM-dependent methyltransferase